LVQADSIDVPIMDNMCVLDLFLIIAERYPQLALEKRHTLLTVNNRMCPEDRVLESDDRISFIPHIGGG
jgi:molybdopterin converting factor small subunit